MGLRFVYTCCQVGGVPMAIAPQFNSFDTGGDVPINQTEGIYCPRSFDKSTGRPIFSQLRQGGYHDKLVHKAVGYEDQDFELRYDQRHKQWCLKQSNSAPNATIGCISARWAHPLDGELDIDSLQMVTLDNFEG